MARQSLGRGLGALLGETATAPTTRDGARQLEIDIDLIDPNPEQPRTRFEDEALDGLARSIEKNGIVQPIVVRPKGSRYEIVAGERRWRASQRAGLRKVPVVVKEVPDERLLELALIENIQRQELNPIEEALAYRKLIDTIGLTQEQVAERVGRERSLVATTIRLLKLPADVQGLIEEGQLSAGHGRAILMVERPERQLEIAREAVKHRWSVRETERAAKRSAAANTAEKQVTVSRDPNVAAAETRLKRTLGTNVKIIPKAGRRPGRIEIEYYGPEDLNRIFEKLTSKEEVDQ
ncbi:MAG: ParB/RepB/Spo0J family partition protein [Pyrinomonadaceae bacterium]